MEDFQRVFYGDVDYDYVRKFRCYDINFHVSSEDADSIIEDKLGYESDNDYGSELIDAICEAQTNYLKRTYPEIIFEVVGNIPEEEIEEFLSDEISSETDWLHEGFQFDEIQ